MTTSEFYEGLEKYMANNNHVIRQWRRGQTVFNYAATVDERVADKLRGTDYDPFHVDSRIERFVDEFCNRVVNTPADVKFYKLVELLKNYCIRRTPSTSWLDDWDAGYDCASQSSVEEIKEMLKKVGIVWETEQ